MKIDKTHGVGSAGGPKKSAGAAAPGFTPAVDAPARTMAAAPAAGVTALDALLALQAEEGPRARRERQLRRGHDALDALDELKRGWLSGRAPVALRRQLEGLRGGAERTGEASLDAVLHEIDTRLAVEAAKLEALQTG